MRQRIALWGYGYYGHDVECAIRHYLSDRYEVTAIFDKKYYEINRRGNEGAVILDPSGIEDCYRSGLFDKVFVTVFFEPEQKRIIAMLEEIGIPASDIGMENTIKQADACLQFEPIIRICQEGYHLYSFKDQNLIVAPRVRYPIFFDADNAVNGTFWTDYQLRHSVFARFIRPVRYETEKVISEDCCMLGDVFSSNYWHFIYETLDKLWLMEKSGYKGKYIVYRTAFSEQFLNLLEISADRIIWANDLPVDGQWRIEKLYYPVLIKGDRQYASPAMMEMSEFISKKIGRGEGTYPERLYVKRIGMRKLLNAESITEKYGFTTIIPEEYSVAEQIRLFMNAKIVFCPHGANTSNALFMKESTALIESFPAGWLNPCCVSEVLSKGIFYLPIFEDMHRSQNNNGYSGDYTVMPEMIETAIRNAIRLTE